MQGFVYLNDGIVPAESARISPFDRGFLLGDGLFETMRSSGGRVHLLRRHLERISRSAKALGIDIPGPSRLREIVEETIAANDGGDWIVRLTVSRSHEIAGAIFVHVRPVAHVAPHAPATIGVLKMAHCGATGHKSTSYLPWIIGMREVSERGWSEGLLLNGDRVVEGTVSNIFRVAGDAVETPPIDSGALPGIGRGRILEIGGELGLASAERTLSVSDLLESDEVFYANAARGIVPVERIEAIDGETLWRGDQGPVTASLARAFENERPNVDV